MNNSKGRREVALHFHCDIFSVDTIKRAAFKFTDRFSFEFGVNDGQISCVASSLESIGPDECELFEQRLRNEVLDQDLRQRIAEETAPLRNTILAYAFSNTGLTNSE